MSIEVPEIEVTVRVALRGRTTLESLRERNRTGGTISDEKSGKEEQKKRKKKSVKTLSLLQTSYLR